MWPDASVRQEHCQGAEKAGFVIDRVKGSHHMLSHEDGRSTTVPIHRNQDTQVGLYRSILRDVELSDEELRNLM